MKSIKTMLLGIAMILLGIWSYNFGIEYGLFGHICEVLSIYSPIIGIIFTVVGFLEKDKQ